MQFAAFVKAEYEEAGPQVRSKQVSALFGTAVRAHLFSFVASVSCLFVCMLYVPRSSIEIHGDIPRCFSQKCFLLLCPVISCQMYLCN